MQKIAKPEGAYNYPEGLRDWEAEVTAYYRAVKQIPNVEMGK